MELSDSLKKLLVETAQALKGPSRRRFMAQTVKELGEGGQRRAESELGWNRETIRKGRHEVESGFVCLDYFAGRGRKRAEELLPNLLTDIKAIVDSQSQADPTFRSQRLYTRLDAREVRQQLMLQKGYTDSELPTLVTITTKLNGMGYYPQKVAKSEPKKKIPETDAIFDQVNEMNQAADKDPGTLRLSMDAKAAVKVGLFARGGKSRSETKAYDHDFKPEATVTPVGIFVPKTDELFIYDITSKVTSDCLVDCLFQWWQTVQNRFAKRLW